MRSTVVYVLMVGTPLLALFGILEAGKQVVPPRSIGGEWTIDGFPAGAPACLQRTADEPLTLRIAQSGMRAELSLRARGRASVAFSAHVDADSLRARSSNASRAGCDELALSARLEGAGAVTQIVGTLVAGTCPSCSTHPFVARRSLPDAEE